MHRESIYIHWLKIKNKNILANISPIICLFSEHSLFKSVQMIKRIEILIEKMENETKKEKKLTSNAIDNKLSLTLLLIVIHNYYKTIFQTQTEPLYFNLKKNKG